MEKILKDFIEVIKFLCFFYGLLEHDILEQKYDLYYSTDEPIKIFYIILDL